MIRLATVFSGIGAIEHALDRMVGIEHQIVFACDNGDVDILTKDVQQNIDKIKEEIGGLNSTIKKLHKQESVEDLYQQQLFDMFNEMNEEYKNLHTTKNIKLE